MSILNPLIVERTTAATDLLLALFALYFCYSLYQKNVADPEKRKYWVIMLAFLGISAFLGAIAHGLDWSDTMRNLIWLPLTLCLGFVISFFVQAVIHERWGHSVSDQSYTWAIFTAFAFFVFNIIFSGSFLLFIGYEAIGMLFCLVVIVLLLFKYKHRAHLYILVGILVSLIAAIVQGTGSLRFNLIWPFDHNSSFHLIQIIATLIIYLGVRHSLAEDETVLHQESGISAMPLSIAIPKTSQLVTESFDEKISQIPQLNLVESAATLKSKKKNIELENEGKARSKSMPHSVLTGFSKDQIKRINKFSAKEKYGPKSVIIQEGDDANHFYLIDEGKVDIMKDGVYLGGKSKNDEFGLMALIDGSKRSADVVASETTVLRSIPFKKLLQKKNKDIYQKLISNQLVNQQKDLKRMNVVTIGEVKQKLEESLKREESSKFFISLVFVLVFYQFFLGVFLEWGDTLRDRSFLEYLTPIFTIFLGVISVSHALKSRYDLSEYGFTTENWRKDIPQALLWTAAFLLFLIGLKWIATMIPGPFYGQPVLDTSSLPDFSPWVLVGIYSLYALLVPVQEIVARGVIQTGLLKIFDGGKWALWKAILLSNCMFSAFHLYLDIKFAILTFIPGLFWGYLFSKQSSLLGVSISHIIIGLFALSFLQNY